MLEIAKNVEVYKRDEKYVQMSQFFCNLQVQ